MSESPQKKVYFLRVNNSSEKLNAICGVIHKHYHKKQAIVIMVPSPEAAVYIDQLLWRHPSDSFLPHVVTNGHDKIKELVIITTGSVTSSINGAKIIFNLCPEPPANVGEFEIVYDLMDLTHASKEQLSQNRFTAYQTHFGAENVMCGA